MNSKMEPVSRPMLETERLILRPFTLEDAPAVYDILSDPKVNRFLPMFPLQSLEEARAYIQKNFLEEDAGYHYAICLKEEDRPIGYVHMSGGESHDFGYGLKREFWRQGIVSEACRAVIEQLKKDGVCYITATHDVNNPNSGGVMRKIGMTYRYSYEEQWQPKNFKVTFRMYQLNLDGETERVYTKYWEQYPVHFVEEGLNG